MRIEFERSGGFMGLRQEVILDTEQLSPQEVEELVEMVEGAGFFDLPEPAEEPNTHADRFKYRLTIERSEVKHTIVMSDSETPENLQPLLQRLNLLARTRKKS